MEGAKELDRSGPDRVRTIDPELLLQQLRSGRAVTVADVRPTDDYRGPDGRVPGARSVPMDELVARCEELTPHRSEPIVVVSGRGERARTAAVALELAGFTEVVALDGGMRTWIDLGLPVEHATVPPSRPVPSSRRG